MSTCLCSIHINRAAMAALDDTAIAAIKTTKAQEAEGLLDSAQAALLRNDIVDENRKRAAALVADQFVTPPNSQGPAGDGGAHGASGSANRTVGGFTPRSLFEPKKRGGAASGFTIQYKNPDGTVMHVVPTDTSVRKGKGGKFPCRHCGKVLERPSGLPTHEFWCKGKGKGPPAVPQRSLFDNHKVRATAHSFVLYASASSVFIHGLRNYFLVPSCFLGPVLWRLWAGRAGSASPSE
jgi:hypothetical protein